MATIEAQVGYGSQIYTEKITINVIEGKATCNVSAPKDCREQVFFTGSQYVC